ncbi:MAG: SPOR domain-containing protein [Bacteroidota bacterium]
MQLETYIGDLLYRYDCVIIPEFGAFLTNKVSAKIHGTTNAFYPPKKEISFNEQLQKNDGLLANYISEVEKIPFAVAVEKIGKKVKKIKAYLIQGETIAFHQIGELKLNFEGNIAFEPSENINYLTASFGLSQITSPHILRETHKEVVEQIEEKAPIALTTERRKKRPYLKYAAIALLALSLAGIGGSKVYLNQIEVQNQIAQEDAKVQLDSKVQQATFVIENPLPSITLNIKKQSGNYHIVAGAFRIESNSDRKVKQLRSQGYKARKIGVNRYGLHEVVYGSYSDRIEALETLRKIKRTHNREAWLLVKVLD